MGGVIVGKCIFCNSEGPFTTIEHIIPESLGNTDDILERDGVCDSCQKYFGKEIEQYVLSKSCLGFYRVLLNIKTKKNREPIFDLSRPEKNSGKIPSYHPRSDYGLKFFPYNGDDANRIEVEIVEDERFNKMLADNKIEIVMTPYMVVNIGRFLGKIALELLFKGIGDGVFDEQYEALRRYSRYGTSNEIWPLLHGVLKDPIHNWEADGGDTESRLIYRYSIFELKRYQNLVIFLFDIGSERYGIVCNQKFPNPRVVDQLIDVDGNKVQFIWYPNFR
ncbi:MAG: hypothetical protein CVV46_06080 [Spirochaetae bacterium HGW-Spirochaetae-2]|nr:MAG: hypothetical protein CVV46_06080 [Spirochaetae bacterium HGW-Spirochaetae-2]